jgi:hypothetical protein
VLPAGRLARYVAVSDLSANGVVANPPFDCHAGEAPAMTTENEADIVAFL